MEKEQVISLPEAAKMIGVSETTLARAARLQTLKAEKIAGVWLVTPTEARRWKTQHHNPNMRRK